MSVIFNLVSQLVLRLKNIIASFIGLNKDINVRFGRLLTTVSESKWAFEESAKAFRTGYSWQKKFRLP